MTTFIDLWTAFSSVTVPAGETHVRSSGYGVAGVGAADYVPDADQTSTTATPWRRKSANGRWFRISGDRITPKQVGALYDGSDAADALAACFAAAQAIGAGVDLLDGVLTSSKPVRLPLGRSIAFGALTLDFRGVTSATAFPEGGCVVADAGPAAALPNLGAAASLGASTITLASSAAGLLGPGDLIAIYNPANYSWIKQWNGGAIPAGQFAAANRANYRAGEMVEVKAVAGAVVTLDGPLHAAYAPADVQLWKMPNRQLVLNGGALTILAPETVDHGLRLRRLRDSDISGVVVRGGRLAAMELAESFNVVGIGLTCVHRVASGAGEDYGLSLVASQRISLQGDFSGHRHGVTVGTSADLAGNLCLPWRDVAINLAGGTMTARADVNAFGGHGCGQGLKLGGVAYGGLMLGGGDIAVDCSIEPIDTMANWPLLSATELWNWNLDLNVAVNGAGIDPTPNGMGLIDFGSNGAAPDAGCVRGGLMSLRGTVRAPSTIRPIKMYANGLPAGAKLGVTLGLAITAAAPDSVIQTGRNSGDVDLKFSTLGFRDLAGGVGFIPSLPA
ncbi:hypothetical protein [Caulobacter mirabilis]|nr:hypothetical protein [Caulobacter mirabilis]